MHVQADHNKNAEGKLLDKCRNRYICPDPVSDKTNAIKQISQ